MVLRTVDDSGVKRVVSHRTVTVKGGRPITMEALVLVRPDGRVVTPTFGAAKGV